MGLLIVKADFTGKYKIAQDNYSVVDSYIAKFEELYLIDLLGVDLFNLFKLDVTAYAPVTAKYLALYNTIRLDDTGTNTIRISEGMKAMVLGFVYFEYMRDMKYKATPSGTVTGVAEVSRETAFEENNIYGRYNSSLASYRTIQWYIENNEAGYEYDEYNGQPKKLVNWL